MAADVVRAESSVPLGDRDARNVYPRDFGYDLGQRGNAPAAELVDGGAQYRGAVFKYAQRHARHVVICRLVVAGAVRATGKTGGGDEASVCARYRFAALAPAEALRSLPEAFDHARAADIRLAAQVFVSILDEIVKAEAQGVEAEPAAHEVRVYLRYRVYLRRAVAAARSGRSRGGAHHAPLVAQRRHPVEARSLLAHHHHDFFRPCKIGAGVHEYFEFAADDAPAGVERRSDAAARRGARARRGDRLAAVRRDEDGAAQLPRRPCAERFENAFLFAAESAAHIRLDDADLRKRQRKHLGDCVLHAEDYLTGRVQLDDLLGPRYRKHAVRLQRRVVYLLRTYHVAFDMRRRCEGRLYVTVSELPWERFFSVLVKEMRHLLRLFYIRHHRQRLVFDLYFTQSSAGRFFVVRKDEGDAVADVARVPGQDAFVAKVVLPGEPFSAVIFVLRCVAEGQDDDAFDFLRLGGVDIFHDRVRLGAEQRHTDQRVLGERIGQVIVRAAHLVRRVLAYHAPADVFVILLIHRPPSSQRASRRGPALARAAPTACRAA